MFSPLVALVLLLRLSAIRAAEGPTCSDEASTVNQVCCGSNGARCSGGGVSACTSACATTFAPFYARCASELAGAVGLDLEGGVDLCQGAGAASLGGFFNGDFDDEGEDICSYVCRAGHAWEPITGAVCGHKY
eukprot:SAG31_NODE_20564_length_571_cov_0.574153_1_plen_132_part_01